MNGKYNSNFTEDLSILDSTGAVIFSQSKYLVINNANSIKLDSYNVKNIITSGGDAGKYILKIIITDLNSKQQTIRQEEFTLK